MQAEGRSARLPPRAPAPGQKAAVPPCPRHGGHAAASARCLATVSLRSAFSPYLPRAAQICSTAACGRGTRAHSERPGSGFDRAAALPTDCRRRPNPSRTTPTRVLARPARLLGDPATNCLDSERFQQFAVSAWFTRISTDACREGCCPSTSRMAARPNSNDPAIAPAEQGFCETQTVELRLSRTDGAFRLPSSKPTATFPAAAFGGRSTMDGQHRRPKNDCSDMLLHCGLPRFGNHGLNRARLIGC